MELTSLNPPNIPEAYKDTSASPDGWEKKLFEMRRGFPVEGYPLYDVFDQIWMMPNDLNSKQCDKLASYKKKYCKIEVPTKCNANTPSDQLKANHDRMMKCRNIRAIENKANCLYEKGWLKGDDMGHQKEIVDIGNGAFKCLTEYRIREKRSKEKQRRLRSSSRRKRIASVKRRSNERKSPKRKSPKRKSPKRKRTPSRKMK